MPAAQPPQPPYINSKLFAAVRAAFVTGWYAHTAIAQDVPIVMELRLGNRMPPVMAVPEICSATPPGNDTIEVPVIEFVVPPAVIVGVCEHVFWA